MFSLKKIFRKLFPKKKKVITCIDGRLYRVSKEELEEIAKVKEIVIQE